MGASGWDFLDESLAVTELDGIGSFVLDDDLLKCLLSFRFGLLTDRTSSKRLVVTVTDCGRGEKAV